MGTNFYWKYSAERFDGETLLIQEDDPIVHIGKRSAAGRYCWDCMTTLCIQGEEEIHFSKADWYSKCPKCQKESGKLKINQSAAGVELGFNKLEDISHRGVTSCCSFSFANDPEFVRQMCKKYSNQSIIRDEYGESYTGLEFLEKILNNCPIHYTRMVGQYFS